MKTKHSRQFRLNNRDFRHFDLLSTVTKKILCHRKKNLLTGLIYGLSGSFCLADNLVAEANLRAIESFAATSIASALPETPAEDISYILNTPPASTLGKHCLSPLEHSWRSQPKAGSNTLISECPSPFWKAYTPVKIEVYAEVVVSSKTLSRGQALTFDDLSLKKLATSRLRTGYFTSISEVSGYELKKSLQADQVITPYIAKAPDLIKRGDWVTIISGSGNLRVTSTGEALKDGSFGDQIPVKNLKSNTRIKARVIDKGLVSTQKGSY